MMHLSTKFCLGRYNSLKLRPVSKLATVIGNSLTTSSLNQDDIVTHTGQSWEDKDRRLARFEVAPKQVNTKWAIDLIKEVPPKPVEGRVAVCEGGPSEALGHPKIYINLDVPGNHSCIYCGLRFYKEDHH